MALVDNKNINENIIYYCKKMLQCFFFKNYIAAAIHICGHCKQQKKVFSRKTIYMDIIDWLKRNKTT